MISLRTLALGTMTLGVLWVGGVSSAAADTPAAPTPQRIAPDIWLLPGGYLPKREPDGNTVILTAPRGLIVFDTGRHAWHTQAIEDFAAARHVPIVAIVNSHWHLDHTSGNIALKHAHPGVKVYASEAIRGALKGFLPSSVKDDRDYLASDQVDPTTAEDVRGDIAVIENGSALIPDVAITASRNVRIGGRDVDVHLAKGAATAGDVWIYDPRRRAAIVGDLVTLPAPFLDTACPAGWSQALAEVWATPFRTALPGHGPPLTRTQFAAYREAFDSLLKCSAGSADKAACAAAWVDQVRPMLDPGALAVKRAQGMTEYYVDLLRHNGGKSSYCTSA